MLSTFHTMISHGRCSIGIRCLLTRSWWMKLVVAPLSTSTLASMLWFPPRVQSSTGKVINSTNDNRTNSSWGYSAFVLAHVAGVEHIKNPLRRKSHQGPFFCLHETTTQ